ncbi:hypothetical protein IW261DRAFT_1666497 [Armillaria novae-zelandiae]|uniref:Transmembrane protein n=1 Tax=Armillaria novae-zelandiae TaxID=153914 RepID=A0AA39NUY2_9AGAR|nr:hypothetical protein IW261DRAFT_1666497 [Armillaria novae-zelandiae]
MTAPHYPPSRIAPLPSTDSSGVSLLDDYDSSKPQTRVSYGDRRRMSIAVIVPGILIFMACAGLASSLLVWLQSRRVESHIPREEEYFKNAIVAIEGATAPRKLDDGSLESDTTMYGLAMSAVSAQLVSLTVPFLLGLLGYRLASMWIVAQENERTRSMLTAAQYGLLVKLCGSANILSAYETVQYLRRGREQRSQAPSSLTFAFVVLVVAIFLNHLLSAADLWLHTTTSTFIYTSITEIAAELMPATGTKINVTMCPGPILLSIYHGIDYYNTCAYSTTDNLGRMAAEGLAVAGNSSSTSRSVIVDNMAVLVPSTMPDNIDNLTFNSFGVVTSCQPVTDCLVDDASSSIDDPTSRDTTIDMFNLTNNALQTLSGGYPLHSVLNPYGARLTVTWSDEEAIFPLMIHLAGIAQTTDFAICTTLNGNNAYTFASLPVLSNFNTTSALFTALHPAYQTNLVDYLKSTLRNSLTLSTETFSTVLSGNMSFGTVGLASPLFERDVSTGGNYIVLRSASRYPLAPLAAVLAILYTYALLALAITVSSVAVSSREVVVTKSSGKEHRITTIELVQLRLTNPLVSIAERFSDPVRPELLLETSAINMFHECPDTEKLGVVMVEYEREDGEAIVRRRRTFKVESVEQGRRDSLAQP